MVTQTLEIFFFVNKLCKKLIKVDSFPAAKFFSKYHSKETFILGFLPCWSNEIVITLKCKKKGGVGGGGMANYVPNWDKRDCTGGRARIGGS